MKSITDKNNGSQHCIYKKGGERKQLKISTLINIFTVIPSAGRTTPSRGSVSSPANLRKQKPELTNTYLIDNHIVVLLSPVVGCDTRHGSSQAQPH